MRQRNTPIILLPIVLIWELIEFILKCTGRLVAAVIGLALMVVGIVLCVTIVGAVAGIPITIFGFMLMVKGFF